MGDGCPVCRETLPESAKHCPRCGFPTALVPDLEGPVSVPLPASEEASEAPALRVPGRPEVVDPESEVNGVLARSLQERMDLLWTIDRDAPDATSALCEAALNEASGRTSDAQQILRSAQDRFDRETEELLARHLAGLESRGQALEATGLRLALEDELGHLAESIMAGDPAKAVADLLASERRLDALEAHWRGLQGLFAQVTTLSEEATALGVDIGDALGRLEESRASLTTMPVREQDLDAAAQIAAETLMRLHDVIPAALEAELAQHAGRLAGHRSRHGRAQSARRLHTDAVQHLKSGRLLDAVQSVRELRAALEELAREAEAAPEPPGTPAGVAAPEPATVAGEAGSPATAPPATPPAVPTPEPSVSPRAVTERTGGGDLERPVPPPETTPAENPPEMDAEAIALLTRKVRSLAVRVRTLPPESEQARTAAREIQETTDLLRSRRFAEADAALTRLMRFLASAESAR